jgi:hypothetical protein
MYRGIFNPIYGEQELRVSRLNKGAHLLLLAILRLQQESESLLRSFNSLQVLVQAKSAQCRPMQCPGPYVGVRSFVSE